MEIQMAGTVEAKARGAATWAWYGLGVLLMTTLFAFVVRPMLSLIAPSLQTSLGFTDLQLGMMQWLGMAVFASVASYPLGWLAHGFGRRPLPAVREIGRALGTESGCHYVYLRV